MVEEVTSLKKDFNQKENKFLEEFLDMKALKEKVEDKLYKQDQSLQTVHVLCKPKPYYDEQRKEAIGYKNPLCLTSTKQVQPALYNGHESIKTNLVPAIVHNLEDTLEIAEITRKKMNEKMKDPKCVKKKRTCKAGLSKLCDKVKKDDYTELVKHFSNLEVNHLNLQLKYQNLKERFRNNTSPPARHVPDFDSVFVIEKMKASIQGKDNAIKKLRMQIAQLKETRSETDRTLDFRALDFQITQLTDKVTVLQEQNELFRTENAKIKQHYKELYDSIKITRAKHIEQTTALLTENENLKAQIHENLKCITMDSVKPRVLVTSRYVIDVELIPPHNRNNREVHLDYLKHLKESVVTLREIVEESKVDRPLDSSLAFACLYTKHSQELLEYMIGTCPKDFNQRDKNHVVTPLTRKKQVTFMDQCETSNSNTHKRIEQLYIQKTNVSVPPYIGVNSCTDASGIQQPVVQIILWYLDSGCSKHMTWDHLRLRNFVNKFIETIRFGNDHFGAIIGYGDYVIGDSVISRVYYVEGLGHNLFFVGNFDDLISRLHSGKHSCYGSRILWLLELIKGSRGSNLYTISVEDMMKYSLICLLSKASKNKSWLWHRRLIYLNFCTINDLARKDLVRGYQD
ncbi:integrase, catalytic region, zinc finger, CCHC-type containing protein [Tanacetum coccineum]